MKRARSSAVGAVPDINLHRAKHLRLATAVLQEAEAQRHVTINEAESPLGWLARRKGKDGRAMIDAQQFLAGERLRADFTRAHAMPRMGADWSSPIGGSRRGADPGLQFSDATLAARQRLRRALVAVGPEFQGILLDVCCFLKGLEDVEKGSGWPTRSGKVVLQLALDRLARHYGLKAEARGRADAVTRVWFADDEDETELSGEGGARVVTDPLDHRA